MKKSIITCLLFSYTTAAVAQKETEAVRKGIEKYKEGKYAAAASFFTDALSVNHANRIARYNLGVAFFKAGETEKALTAFNQLSNDAGQKDNITFQALYNKAFIETQHQNWPSAIALFKEALHLQPGDADTRYNLEKALESYKKTQQKQEPEKNKNETTRQQPPPQATPPVNKERLEQWLTSLRQKEQAIQRKMQQKSRTTTQPANDW